jgi:EAL domain-containing protein (putative c-di-GMP-specific phosphodiesterase class I)/ActR/RegA family two-component response regulator
MAAINPKGAALVVDDDRFQQEIVGQQLRDLGWTELYFADSGRIALQLFDDHRASIRIIISDLSMPDMDGLVLMRHFAERKLDAAIILISGVSDEILNSAAGLASAHQLYLLGVLAKPSSLHNLMELLSKLDAPVGSLPASQAASLSPQRLREALDHHEFVPWYQPKVNAITGKAEAVEALARWQTEGGGMVGPGQFVPAIENAGLADALFYAIARQVIEDMTHWRTLGLDIKAAINLSMDSALNLDMPETLHALVLERGLHASDFIIEVTESRLMVKRSLAMESLTRLSLMGFKLSIDDFGTGYSSMVQLIDLPFRELKIDGSFVQRASLEEKARAILRVSAMLGSTLNMAVTAEGVETAEQLRYVRECGCDTVQGYYFARPMPFETCSRWLLAAVPSAAGEAPAA